jgi:hypothetical protein
MVVDAYSEVYDGWLNPKIPGTPWHEADKLILNPKVDGLFYWLIRWTPSICRTLTFISWLREVNASG